MLFLQSLCIIYPLLLYKIYFLQIVLWKHIIWTKLILFAIGTSKSFIIFLSSNLRNTHKIILSRGNHVSYFEYLFSKMYYMTWIILWASLSIIIQLVYEKKHHDCHNHLRKYQPHFRSDHTNCPFLKPSNFPFLLIWTSSFVFPHHFPVTHLKGLEVQFTPSLIN